MKKYQYLFKLIVIVFSLGILASCNTCYYGVTYDGNGNTAGYPPSDPNSPYLSGATVIVLDNTGNLTKNGYTFSGWNTEDNGSGTTYLPSDKFIMPSREIILYAKWKPSTNNNAPGTLQFSSATYSVNENAGSITVSVTRSDGSDGAVSVSYATSNGTATSGSDYTSRSGTLSWGNGDTSTKTITIPIIDDSTYEGNETFAVTLSNATGGASIGSPSTATITIIDDDIQKPGTLQFSSATYSVNENAGSITVSVTRSDGSDGAVSVSYATSNGTATSGSDYTSRSGTLSWGNGDTSTKTITIPIIDDSTYEGNETFAVTLSNATGGASIGSPSTATITIIDDDIQKPGTLQFSSATYSVNENAGSITVSVTRSDGSDGAVSVSYATSNGTATSGSDYTSRSGTLSWGNGDTSTKTITIPIIDDSTYEGNETFAVTLSNATGGASIGSPSTATITIIDDDIQKPGTLQFSSATYSVNENAGSITVSVTRSDGSDGAVSVSYATSNGTATSGSDYTSRSGTLSWGNGDTSTKTITIPIIDDSTYEGNETFAVTLSNATGGASIGSPSTTTVTIIDDELLPANGILLGQNKTWNDFNYSKCEEKINQKGSSTNSYALVLNNNQCYIGGYAFWELGSGTHTEAYAQAGEKFIVYGKNDGTTVKSSNINFSYAYYGDISEEFGASAQVTIKIRLVDFDNGSIVQTKTLLDESVTGPVSYKILDGSSGRSASITANLTVGKTYLAYIQIYGICNSNSGLIANNAEFHFDSSVSPYKLLRLYNITISF
jgi:uncharacterized repeat protein (TIGR02543 family)